MNSGVSYSQRNIPKTIENQNGVFVESVFSNGVNRKSGIMTFANGDKIIGEWKNDTLSGLSKIIYKDGYIEQGRWNKGVLKEKYDILEFYEDAQPNASVKQSLNNKNNGKLFNLFRNGELISQEHYLNGKKVKEIEYENDFDNRIKIGDIKRESIYEGDLVTSISYLDNGKLSRKSSISTGSSEGWETFHNKKDILIGRSFYKNDNIIINESYFENGIMESLDDPKVYWVVNEKGEKTRNIDKISKTGFIVFDGPNDNKSMYKWVGEIDVNSNRPKGKGTLYLTNGDKIIGSYDTTNFQGEGEYYFKNGNVYKGNLKNGNFEGLGNFLYKNGNAYKGNFKNSLRDGYGKLTNKDGSKFEGIWQDDKLVEDYNKEKSVAIVKAKASGQNKKYTTPPLHLSSSELRAWFDSEDGQKYLIKSGMLKGLQNEMFKQAGEMAINNSSSSVTTQSKSSGNKSCQRCNIAFQKPYLLDRCKTEWKKESKPGYVLCKTCQGYGFTITNIGCNCPDGIGWCYDKECPVSSCESGWIKCSH
jgi:hypothetical protein